MTFDQESMRIVCTITLRLFWIYSQYGHYHWRYSWGYDDFIPAGAFKKIGSHLKIIVQTISVQPHGFSGPDSESGHRGPHERASVPGDKLNEIDRPFLVQQPDAGGGFRGFRRRCEKAMETELEQLDERHALDRRFYEGGPLHCLPLV